ncbi:MAG: DNA polymerase II large subunit [Candidatus Altiarchaeota archaeon]|nr:DNA polymerase II large subunit [Candidatus Altiarchaeota archaeon]
MEKYFTELRDKISQAYEIANKARAEGKDPDFSVESLPAGDLATRVEGLVGPEGIATKINELGRENLAQILDYVLGDVSGIPNPAKEKRIEQALRTGLAIITEGVVAAPIEGISRVKINSNADGSERLSVYFAGPIRSAGGTAQGLAVLIGDYLRTKTGLQGYRPTGDEIERYVEEIKIYNERVTRLQYMPSDDEIRFIVKNLSVCVDGDPTEKREVSIHRDLKGVETNRIRGGMCLVIAEGIAQKSSKLMKHASNMELEWGWLSDIGKNKDEGDKGIKPLDLFMSETVGGRPVFASPSAKGAFRLRYGRGRATGIAAKAMHPATMILLDEFIATGTQVKVERPGKGCIITNCNEIDGPIVKLKDGSVVRADSEDYAKKINEDVVEVLFLGDILISYGDMLQTNTSLLPAGYCEEWWKQEAIKVSDRIPLDVPSADEAVQLAKEFSIPLHPRYTYFWEDIGKQELKLLVQWLSTGQIKDGRFMVENNPGAKRVLELLGAPHEVDGNIVIIDEYLPLLYPTGAYDGVMLTLDEFNQKLAEFSGNTALEFIQTVSPITIRARAGTYIGARMGRPEKARERKMQPAVHSLFPIGDYGGRERDIRVAAENSTIRVDIASYECSDCRISTISSRCPQCAKNTAFRGVQAKDINMAKLWSNATKRAGRVLNVKGVKGMISKDKIPEPLEKGILRAKNDVFVFKDGTIRFDATDAPLTHFKPAEVGVGIDRLKELGYRKDYKGEELKSPEQILELRVQDIIMPTNGAQYFLKVSRFIDDLLERFYGLPRFYNAKMPEDLLGHLVVGLAPHTSAGIVGRIVGFNRAAVCYAHPFWHAAKRRNCLSPDSGVLILNSDTPKVISMEELYEHANSSNVVVDDFGTIEKPITNARTLALNPENGKIEIKDIKSVIRTPSPKHLIEIITRSGRRFVASPEHRMMVHSNGRLSTKKVLEIGNQDKFLIPEGIHFDEKDVEGIDLLEEFRGVKGLRDCLMVRGIRKTTDSLIEKLGGLKAAANKLEMNKKTFSNYVYRDSIPLAVLESMLSLSDSDWTSIPLTCKLGVSRDHAAIPRVISVDENLLRLIGYYLAEGYSRKIDKCCYQVNLAAMESDMIRDMESCIKSSLGISPSIDKHILVIPNRLIYHFFIDILKIGKGAKDKRIPHIVSVLPKKKTRELLMAYFSGDGSVEKDRLHVTCSSVNEKLLEDIGLQLLRFGIFYRIKTEERTPSGVVKEFYEKKGLKPRFKLHYLSIRSTYARKFYNEIGFSLKRKHAALKSVLGKERKPRLEKFGDFILDGVKEVKTIKSGVGYLYDIEVEDHHNFLTNHFLLSANCDGDEDSLMLILDTLINFSKRYLPEERGGKMDAPLVITTVMNPKEVDDEAHKVEIIENYPLEFYEKTWLGINPSEIKIKTVNDVLDSNPFSGLMFTHSTGDITGPVIKSRYLKLGKMKEKVDAQLKVAEKIRAIDEKVVAELVINSHFLRDIYGNLRTFTKQKFRCVKCNASYRRVPLSGKCTKCGDRLLLTVSEGSIRKYLGISGDLCRRYNCSPYMDQRLTLLKRDIDSLFTNDLSKQVGLSEFM